MGKPSIFSSDYKKIMHRRKIVFRVSIVLVALAVVLLMYGKSTIPNLKKLAGNIKMYSKIDAGKYNDSNAVNDKKDVKGKDAKNDAADKVSPDKKESGKYQIKVSDAETVAVTYEKDEKGIKITGIEPDDGNISFDIKDDMQAITFDNPKAGDIWIVDANGNSKKLNPDFYKMSGGTRQVFYKNEIMKRYNNDYVWAAKPKFLKDGRIVYQSNLPWFKDVKYIYIWVVDMDGQNNNMVANTNSTNAVSYGGFLNDGRLIIEHSGAKYAVNVDKKKIEAID